MKTWIKQNKILLIIILGLIIIITILGFIIKFKNKQIKEKDAKLLEYKLSINQSNIDMNSLLDANEYLKLQHLREIAKRDSIDIILNNEISHANSHFHNPITMPNDSIYLYITNTIYGF